MRVDAGDEMIDTRTSFCRFCHAACPIEVDVDTAHSSGHEHLVAIRGVRSDPLFEGYTCIKGRQLPDQHHAPDRLRAPLRRRDDGGLDAITTGAAMDEIAERVAAILRRDGARAVATYTGTGSFQNALSMPTTRAFLDGIDSPSFYTSVTIDQPAHATARLRMGAWEAGWQNFRDADVSLAIGYNPLVSSYAPAGGLQGTNPFVTLRRAKARGMKLIVIDPRRSELAASADVWLAVTPGEDPTLLAGMINVIVTEGLHDAEFCRGWVDQLDELRGAVAPFTLDRVATRCGVAVDDVVRAARLFAAGPRGVAGTGTGPNMAPHSTLTEHLTLTLNAICGRVNRAGDHLESPSFFAPGNTRRAQVIAPADPAPGAPHRVKGLRGLPGEMLTPLLAEEILEPGEGRVRALFVCGGNPVVAFPDQLKTIAALRDLELLVVIDHRMTPTAELAHFVIAPRLQLERADVPAVMDRRFSAAYFSHTPAVLEPVGDLLSEWELFAGIANRIGTRMPLPGGDLPLDGSADDESVLDLIYADARVPMAEVRRCRGSIDPSAEILVVAADDGPQARLAVAPPDVVRELAEVEREGTSGEVLAGFTAEGFPFRLVSRRLKHVLNSLGSELPGLARVGTTNPAYLHPTDMASLGLADGDLVEITSPTGSIVGVAASDESVKVGVVSMAHSWGRFTTDELVREHGSPTNRLCSVDSGYDPINGMAVQSAIPVALRRAEQPAPDNDEMR